LAGAAPPRKNIEGALSSTHPGQNPGVECKSKSRPGDRAELRRGRKSPKTSDSARVCRYSAERATEGAGASSGAAGTPRELRVSRRSAGSRIGERPWGAGSTRYGSPSRRGRKRARGPVGAKALATVREWCASKGISGVLGPWPWNQGGRAQVLRSLRSLRPRIPQSSRLMSTVGEGAQQMRKRVSASPSERAPRE